MRLHPRKAQGKCALGGKTKWKSNLDAQMALANIRNKQGSATFRTANSKQEIRAYHCQQCHYWHTTSQPDRRLKAPDDHS